MKGGQTLAQPAPIRTDRQGAFDLASIRELVFFRDLGWTSVTLWFSRRGYQPVVTNLSIEIFTNAVPGAPRLDAGEIRLSPREP